MIVLGINSGITRKGRPLNDGGACIVKDGEILCAIQEERITRNKYEGGFEQSIKYVCEGANILLEDIDYVAVSSCIDEAWSVSDAMKILKLSEKYGFRKNQVIIVDHHLSHAFCGFISSGYEQALICVLDNTGNKLTKEKNDIWDAAFQRNSYYIGSWKNGAPSVDLIERDADISQEIGYGEAYRYFTHYFGWDSYKHSGKTMGLAAYGRPQIFRHLELFKHDNNKEICLLGPKHAEPEHELKTYFSKNNVQLPRKLYKNESVTQYYADMAYFLQKEFEKSILRKVEYLQAKHKLHTIVLSGGVALNCIANALIYELPEIKDVYIPCAPGDDGQSMGNALYGYFNKTKSDHIPKKIIKSYFGKEYTDMDWISYAREKNLSIKKSSQIEKDTALLLTKAKIVGWFQSNSEFGPRALGHRSIIADPRFDFMKDKINSRIKFREPFRPFAPSFLYEHQKEYFKSYRVKSYFMSFGLPIISKFQRYIPAVTHVDGTARLQSVTKESDSKYHALIEEFRKITKIPCILNTSFNLNDEPIVETPIHAINTFLRCHMDNLVIGDYILSKPTKKLNDAYNVHIMVKLKDTLLTVKKKSDIEYHFISGEVKKTETIPHAVVRLVKEMTNLAVHINAKVFEDLVPKKDYIEHNIWFEVTAREDTLLLKKNYEIKQQSTVQLKKDSQIYENMPIFVKRNARFLTEK